MRVQRGFTLIELLVVIAIITIISTIILANNNRFGGQVQLQNLAYDIALSIRQAQVYGISVQRFGVTGTQYAPGYGMHFATNVPNNYILFGDIVTANGVYTAGELVQSTTIQSGYTIAGLFVTPPGGTETPATSIDITFRRPDPDAYITRNGSGLTFNANGSLLTGTIYEQARILVRSPRNDLKNIIISANGQISVQ
jgi:prepilin-type N-terminal cleavage/methylation domain-containing protein